ncbi:MAG: hypothetical protein QHI48_02840 [Bacteroidota bacterium]|nr:hypothetical protein [Bacteroidota bacterium]
MERKGVIPDEISRAHALEAAIRAQRASLALFRTLMERCRSRTLRYQYQAIMENDARWEQRFLRYRQQEEEQEPSGTIPPAAGIDGSSPHEDELRVMPLRSLIEQGAREKERIADLFEDLASRCADETIRMRLLEASRDAVHDATKLLTDLQLMRQYPDYG